MSDQLKHFSYMHQGWAVSITALLVHLSQIHQGPTVGVIELLTGISQVHTVKKAQNNQPLPLIFFFINS